MTATVVETPAPHIQSPTLLCSPVDGVPLDQLEGMISNPYNPPPFGSDDPHQGVDLADIDPQRVARGGRQVNALLSGQVTAVIYDRFPYGYALLVETTLASFSEAWVDQLDLPLQGLPQQVTPVLTCPALQGTQDWDDEIPSLYLLYAHLEKAPDLQIGDRVECGEVIGTIGSSGNALNPHLHLEARTGPGGAVFSSMAHYDPSASLEEMAAYCTWRVSGSFQHFDPMRLLALQP